MEDEKLIPIDQQIKDTESEEEEETDERVEFSYKCFRNVTRKFSCSFCYYHFKEINCIVVLNKRYVATR